MEALKRIEEMFKDKEDEIISIKKSLGEKELELKEFKNKYAILEGRYLELNSKWNKINELFKGVGK
jgi:predicted  nucleic acid-binding Zn-ribbon protein|tara:strand:+ start:744 stop:941 length:198 start_codon:yes stop_codon:yes gene_type:complete